MNTISAYEFDWNPITVEGYSEKKNEIIMVFNFDVTTEDKVKNVVQYVVGRTAWGYKNFPKDSKIILSFDFRGQNIIGFLEAHAVILDLRDGRECPATTTVALQ